MVAMKNENWKMINEKSYFGLTRSNAGDALTGRIVSPTFKE
jgi:hypothetical protein